MGHRHVISAGVEKAHTNQEARGLKRGNVLQLYLKTRKIFHADTFKGIRWENFEGVQQKCHLAFVYLFNVHAYLCLYFVIYTTYFRMYQDSF